MPEFWKPTDQEVRDMVRRREMTELYYRMDEEERVILKARYLASEDYSDLVARMKMREEMDRQQRLKRELERKKREREQKELEAIAEYTRFVKAEEKRQYKLAHPDHTTIDAYNERERRSRIRWEDLIDDLSVVKRQMVFERGATALAMRKAGIGYLAIGERLGVSKSRAQQIVDRAERWATRRSPAEVYLAEPMPAQMKPRAAAKLKMAVECLTLGEERDWIWLGLAA